MQKCSIAILFFLLVLDAFSQSTKVVTVAQDGSGDYTTVQAALNAVPSNNKTPFIIYIKNGVYKEKILLDSTEDL